MKKFIKKIVFLFLLITVTVPSAMAKSIDYAPYWGYEYNDYNESVAAPAAYVPDAVYYSKDMGLETAMMNPGDFCYDNQGAVYILDSGNGRILQLDLNFKVTKIYDTFHTADGEERSILEAQGFTLDNDGNFYIAATADNKVMHIGRDGLVLQEITRPDAALPDTDAPFKATKVAVDRKDNLYVLVDNINMGAFVFRPDGTFDHFFGSNPIVKTGEVIQRFIWKRFMTKEQRKGMERITPTVFSNFDFDSNGFLYTVTADHSTTALPDMVRRLNYQGTNILPDETIFGDLEWDRALQSESLFTSFTDVDIDSGGFINLLDVGRGRIFQYTTKGEMIAVFGSFSDQVGGFSQPVAVETIGDNVYVLDAIKNCVVKFKPSSYGSSLRTAFQQMEKTVTQSLDIWQDVLKQNTNSLYPYYGIGMYYDAQGDFKQAMDYFRLAGAHEEYSKSFREYRKVFIGQYYWLVLIVGIVLIGSLSLVGRRVKRKFAEKHGTAYSAIETKYSFPIYTTLHPADGFDQFKSRKIASYRLSILLIAILFVVKTLEFFYTGFSFNLNRPIDYQFLVSLFISVGIIILFIAANWSVCTLFNGKGMLKEITAVCSYALLPYISASIINIFLSNILTMEERTFMSLVTMIGVIWSLIILIIGLQSIHQYSFGQTIGSFILTIIGMIIIVFLIVLFYTLLQQTFNFIRSLFMELELR